MSYDQTTTDLLCENEALRKRCEDAELMLRALGDVERVSYSMDLAGGWNIELRELCSDERCENWHVVCRFRLEDDGTGLPILTDKARKELRGKEEKS